ncbi:SRPBCC family protein [Actinophytocola glycyrrhizae]|uniref:SRPBCC family protein n=1 Tax=Actinophytocola glycyrrhizae TaxID=2044873 RepID=A0ABV9S8C0_9PSEU
MTELKIWTTRQTVRVTAPPKRVYELVADIEGWPTVFDTVAAVERLGIDRGCERFRIVERTGNTWTSVREANTKRLQVRYRRIDPPVPLESMAGLWRVETKVTGVVVALDHYFRVAEDNPETAAVAAEKIAAIGTAMLGSLRRVVDSGGAAHPPTSCSDDAAPERKAS